MHDVAVVQTLSSAQARRIALAAQGFGTVRPAGVLRTIDRLALSQIDSVNVLVRAHYLPAFSRLGEYDRGVLDRLAWGARSQRRLFEYWGHEASLLPLDLHPLLRWRMADADRGVIGWKHLREFAVDKRGEAMAVLARVAAQGSMAASDFEDGRGRSGWWEWGDTKRALEWLFWAGHLTTATRRASFERVYDLPERVIPAAILALPTPAPAAARRALIARAGKALGIATAADLGDYFRLSPAAARAAIAALVEEGMLLPAAVAGWSQPAFLHREAKIPRRIDTQALLAPFDPLVWMRDRVERLFGFRYRLEIYTPAAQRVHGYYVLPFLLGDALVGRVDLKSDRAAGRLLVQRVTMEPDAPADARERLGDELTRLAGWLGLEPPPV